MRLSTTPSTLAAAVRLAGGTAIGGRIVAAYNNVLLEADPDGGLHVTGTDLAARVKRQVSAIVEEAGATTVGPKALGEFLALCPDSTAVTLELSGARLKLACGRAAATLPVISADEYPARPLIGQDRAHATVPATWLRAALGATVFAAAPDDRRPVLGGAWLRIADGRLTVAAADRFRIAVARVACEGDGLSAIIGAKSLVAISRSLDGRTGDVALSASDNVFGFDVEGLSWMVQPIDGQFPDVNRIIPRDPPTTVTVDREALLRAVRLAVEVGRADSLIVRLTASGESLKVRGENGTDGYDADDECDAEISGPEQVVGFNGKYLRDALSALEGARVVLSVTGPVTPMAMRAEDGAGRDVEQTHVIGPMAVKR